MTTAAIQSQLSQRKIYQTWWPLAASWLLMGLELPILSAAVARLADPEIHLAAYGGVVFPVALLIESPIIMLLAASTALSKDWPSYLKLRRFMAISGFALTTLHALVAFTPLYDWLVIPAFNPPQEIVEPARLGLMIMTPWTWSIAYRRFQQGLLIRFGRSRIVTQGTMVRLLIIIGGLGIGYAMHRVAGIAVATSAIASAVVAEAVYIGWRKRTVMHRLKAAPRVNPPLTTRAFGRFYLPLALTELLGLLTFPLSTAAISRMPQPLESLAVWPVLSGLLFLITSIGIAYNEVVVALLDEAGSVRALRRFAWTLAAAMTLFLTLVTATPLSGLWLERLSALSPALAALAHGALWFALVQPGINVIRMWFQGSLIYGQKTRPVTEAVLFFLGGSALVLLLGTMWGNWPGAYVGQAAFLTGAVAEALWLRGRSFSHIQALERAQS